MRRIRRDNLIKRTAGILRNNDGASLLMVSIIAILVLSAVIILRISTTTFMASSTRQLNQDQAYELAASLGESIDILIAEGKCNIKDINGTIYSQDTGFVGMPDASVKAEVSTTTDGGKKLTVTSKVGKATYVYTKEYR